MKWIRKQNIKCKLGNMLSVTIFNMVSVRRKIKLIEGVKDFYFFLKNFNIKGYGFGAFFLTSTSYVVAGVNEHVTGMFFIFFIIITDSDLKRLNSRHEEE